MEKTQCWDLEEIQAALREAYVQGIDVESLYRHNYRKPEIAHPAREIRPKV